MVMMPIVGMLLSRIQARWLVIFGLLVVFALACIRCRRFNLDVDFSTP